MYCMQLFQWSIDASCHFCVFIYMQTLTSSDTCVSPLMSCRPILFSFASQPMASIRSSSLRDVLLLSSLRLQRELLHSVFHTIPAFRLICSFKKYFMVLIFLLKYCVDKSLAESHFVYRIVPLSGCIKDYSLDVVFGADSRNGIYLVQCVYTFLIQPCYIQNVLKMRFVRIFVLCGALFDYC